MLEDVEEPIVDTLIEPSSSPISELHEDAGKMKVYENSFYIFPTLPMQ